MESVLCASLQIQASGRPAFRRAATLDRLLYGVPPQQISSPMKTPRALPLATCGLTVAMNVSVAFFQPGYSACFDRSNTSAPSSTRIFIFHFSVIVLLSQASIESRMTLAQPCSSSAVPP